MGIVTTCLEVAGAAAIVTGVALIFVPAAFIVGGVLLLTLSYGVTHAGGAE